MNLERGKPTIDLDEHNHAVCNSCGHDWPVRREGSGIHLGLLFVLTLALSGCSLIRVTHCTYWNLLPALGIPHNVATCPGGQPTVTTVKIPTIAEAKE